MSELYNRIEKLCSENGVNITSMCKESGASRASLTDLKMGRKQNLSTETLSKIASYFGVTVDSLLGAKQKETVPAETGKGVSDDDIKAAFFGGADSNLTKEEIDAMWKDAQEYFRFKIAQRRQNKQDGE